MEQILEDVKRYDIAKIRQKLGEYGVKVGPITSFSKPLFEKRLARKILESEGGTFEENERTDSKDDVKKTNVPPVATEQTSVPSIYYGICLPEDLDPQLAKEATQLVFSDKVQAMQMAKKLRGSRFKVFKIEEEANKFSRLTSESAFQSPRKSQKETLEDKSQVVTESSPYKAPKPQDIVVVRLAIERGDSKTFEDYIWNNPRYLVSSGDTPAIYQEGSRYTAMHVAAMKNKPAICRLILNVLEDPQFINDLYRNSKVTDEAVNTRIGFLVDLYLNMPDKGNCESPLHMACKFGHEHVVEILATHPRTDRFLRNKWGDLPKDVICTRCPHSSVATRERIAELLQGQCYVPLIRSEDNSTQPLIGQPWSPDITSSPLDITKPTQGPCDPTVSVRACAGPMSPSNADLFHKRWTTPPSRSPAQAKKYFDTKRSDCEKGLERIGRHLAHDMAVPWLEYWAFLDSYVDLSTQKGLDILEEYFRKSLWVTFFKDYKEKYGVENVPDPADFCTPVKTKHRGLGNDTTDSPLQDNVFSSPVPSLLGKKEEGVCDTKDNSDHSEKDSEQTNSEECINTIVSPVTSLLQKFAELSMLDRSWSDKATINTSRGSELPELDGSVSSSAENDANTDTRQSSSAENDANIGTRHSSSTENGANTSTCQISGAEIAANTSTTAGDLSTAGDSAGASVGALSNGADTSDCHTHSASGGKMEPQRAAGAKSDDGSNSVSEIQSGEQPSSVSDTNTCDRPLPVIDATTSEKPVPVSDTSSTAGETIEPLLNKGADVLNNKDDEYFDTVSDLSENKDSITSQDKTQNEVSLVSSKDITGQDALSGANGADLKVVTSFEDKNQTDTDINLHVNGDRIARQLSDRSDSTASYKTAEEDNSLPYERQLSEPNHVNVYIKFKDDSIVKKLEQVFGSEQSNSSVQLLVRLQFAVMSGGLKMDIVIIPELESASQMVGLYEDIEVLGCDGDIHSLGEGDTVDVGGLNDGGEDLKFPAHFTRASPVQKVGYIYGPLPCREDLDVSRALGEVFISPEYHPNVFHWKINLLRFTSDTKYRWQSPAKLKSKHLQLSPHASPSPRHSPGVPYGSPVHLFGQGRSANAGTRTRLQFTTIQEL